MLPTELDKISAEEFEKLCYQLLEYEGFFNLQWYGKSGHDRGRDIVGYTIEEPITGQKRKKKWVIQCKKRIKKKFHGSPLKKSEIKEDLAKTTEHKPDYFLLITNLVLSGDMKDWLESQKEQYRFDIIVWDELNIESLLNKYPNWDILLEACQIQIKNEINAMVGRKYIPDLYVNREIEDEFEQFMKEEEQIIKIRECVQEIEQIISETQIERLNEIIEYLKNIKYSTIEKSKLKQIKSYMEKIEEIFEKWIDEKQLLEEDKKENKVKKIKQLTRKIIQLFEETNKNCFLIVDKAGSGKTNLLCHLVEKYSEEIPAVFLSARFTINDEYSIEKQIQMKLQYHLDVPFQEYLKGINVVVSKKKSWFLIFIDGINENKDIIAMKGAINNILGQHNDKRFKFCISCRDIFWSFFDDQFWGNYVYKQITIPLHDFSEEEFSKALALYLTYFQIKGELIEEAKEKCKQPLMLRFFCESYKEQDVGIIKEIRLKELFDLYWMNKMENIRKDLKLRTTAEIERFLISIVQEMRIECTASLNVEKMREVTQIKDIESENSVYTRVLDEDIILEEEIDKITMERRIGFVYDEFFEYIMAREIVKDLDWSKKNKQEIVSDLCDYLIKGTIDFVPQKETDRNNLMHKEVFPHLEGAIEYLLLIMEGQEDLHLRMLTTLSHFGKKDLVCRIAIKLKDCDIRISKILKMAVKMENQPIRTYEEFSQREKTLSDAINNICDR